MSRLTIGRIGIITGALDRVAAQRLQRALPAALGGLDLPAVDSDLHIETVEFSLPAVAGASDVLFARSVRGAIEGAVRREIAHREGQT